MNLLGSLSGKPHAYPHRRRRAKKDTEYTGIDDGYYAILGSPKGVRTGRMLIDHQAAINHRSIERIVVFGCHESGDVEDKEKSRTYMIVLSD